MSVHEPFVAQGTDINCQPITKTIKPQTPFGEVVMGIPGFDCDYTYVTKAQAMKFFDLVERSKL